MEDVLHYSFPFAEDISLTAEEQLIVEQLTEKQIEIAKHPNKIWNHTNNFIMKIKKFFETILGGAIGVLLLFAVVAVLFIDPEWICQIKNSTRYVWWEGIWHALWFKTHFIRNIFVDTNCVGRGGSFMYNVCFYSTLMPKVASLLFFSGSNQDKKSSKEKAPNDEHVSTDENEACRETIQPEENVPNDMNNE